MPFRHTGVGVTCGARAGPHPGLMCEGQPAQKRARRDTRAAGLGELAVLSDECIMEVLQLLPGDCLARVSTVSRALYFLAAHNELWKALVLEVRGPRGQVWLPWVLGGVFGRHAAERGRRRAGRGQAMPAPPSALAAFACAPVAASCPVSPSTPGI